MVMKMDRTGGGGGGGGKGKKWKGEGGVERGGGRHSPQTDEVVPPSPFFTPFLFLFFSPPPPPPPPPVRSIFITIFHITFHHRPYFDATVVSSFQSARNVAVCSKAIVCRDKHRILAERSCPLVRFVPTPHQLPQFSTNVLCDWHCEHSYDITSVVKY